MKYRSTRGNTEFTFLEVLLQGLAPDGGLFVPQYYPAIGHILEEMRGWSYWKVAEYIIGLFVGLDMTSKEIQKIVRTTYARKKFGRDIVPIKDLGNRMALLGLSEGPTSAFKDMALQLLGSLMEHALDKEGRTLNLLGATSGDTGSAAEESIRGRRGMNIFMLSPSGERMTPIQRAQMWTINAPNVHNLVADADFGTLQDAVKLVNGDAEFKAEFYIGAVNSINWARIMAQTVYWVYGYLKMTKPGEKLTVSIPSGNFGNALSAYIAYRMGVLLRIVVATNENDVLHNFFSDGVYRPQEDVVTTLSPSMDIKTASNLERFIFDMVTRSPDKMRDLLGQLRVNGSFDIEFFSRQPFCPEFRTGRATDQEVLQTMHKVYQRFRYLVDPHTAVAMKVVEDLGFEGEGPVLIAETALPVKFEEAVRRATGRQIEIPERLQAMCWKPWEIHEINGSDPAKIAEAVKAYIRSHA
ncbi:threonine synthase [Candidatus Nomurabacteria bacterium]|nr:threonine synthase [Candidatus Nomurabacteria bacterium]